MSYELTTTKTNKLKKKENDMTKSKLKLPKLRQLTEKNLEAFLGDTTPVPPRWKMCGVLFVKRRGIVYRFIRQGEVWIMYEKHKIPQEHKTLFV